MTAPATYTTAAEAKAHGSVLAEQWRRHRKICRTCRQLTGDRNRYCSAGWDIAKAMAKAASAVRDLTAPAGQPADTLF